MTLFGVVTLLSRAVLNDAKPIASFVGSKLVLAAQRHNENPLWGQKSSISRNYHAPESEALTSREWAENRLRQQGELRNLILKHGELIDNAQPGELPDLIRQHGELRDLVARLGGPIAGSLNKLEISKLHLSPMDTELPAIDETEPDFCAGEGWLADLTGTVLDRLKQRDDDATRVSPVALVRFSRGGKTRALKELAASVRREDPGIAVIYVTLNDYTEIRKWEQEDPVAALCRRIAFAGMRDKSGFRDFSSFAKITNVTREDVVDWLHSSKCLLLIDELNLIHFRNKDRAADVASFLKDNFLIESGRFFVFSSHVVPQSPRLAKFMDNISGRSVNVFPLPVIPSLKGTSKKLRWPTLTDGEAVCRGRAPALIYLTRPGAVVNELFAQHLDAIDSVQHLWNDERVRQFLRTFITGQASDLFQQLLTQMNTCAVGITWIPYHVQHVLESVIRSEKISTDLKSFVSQIALLMGAIEKTKLNRGVAWEYLFVIAMLLRLETRVHHKLLNVDQDFLVRCSVSYNQLWKSSNPNQWRQPKSREELVPMLQAPPFYPHMSVYYQPYECFKTYEFFTVAYEEPGKRKIICYQLIPGPEIPKQSPNGCDKAYLIRAKAASNDKEMRGWDVVSKGLIDEFLGMTGASLTPMEWRAKGLRA